LPSSEEKKEEKNAQAILKTLDDTIAIAHDGAIVNPFDFGDNKKFDDNKEKILYRKILIYKFEINIFI